MPSKSRHVEYVALRLSLVPTGSSVLGMPSAGTAAQGGQGHTKAVVCSSHSFKESREQLHTCTTTGNKTTRTGSAADTPGETVI